jgi:hypothetical protein
MSNYTPAPPCGLQGVSMMKKSKADRQRLYPQPIEIIGGHSLPA